MHIYLYAYIARVLYSQHKIHDCFPIYAYLKEYKKVVPIQHKFPSEISHKNSILLCFFYFILKQLLARMCEGRSTGLKCGPLADVANTVTRSGLCERQRIGGLVERLVTFLLRS